jgi:hypothetical protein
MAYLEDARETATPAEYAVYMLLAGTAARIDEVTGAAADAFDPRTRSLRIERTLVKIGKIPVFGPPKTDAAVRVIPKPPAVLPVPIVEAIESARMEAGSAGLPGHGVPRRRDAVLHPARATD